MAIVDNQIAWMRKKIWLPAYYMNMVLDDGTSGVPQSSISGAGVTQLEISTFGPIGWEMTDGEFMTGAFPLPYDLDPKHELGFKIVYFVNASGACTVNWILQYKLVKEGVAYAVPSQALDTVIALADAYGSTDWVHAVTARGIALPGTHGIVRDDVDEDAMLMLEVEMDAAANETAIGFYGIIMDYVPQKCTGVGCVTDRPLLHTDIL